MFESADQSRQPGEHFGYDVAEDNALRRCFGSAERNGISGVSGKVPALGDRTYERCSENIERLWRYDKNISCARLLATVDRVQVNVVDIAAIHSRLAPNRGRIEPRLILFRHRRLRIALGNKLGHRVAPLRSGWWFGGGQLLEPCFQGEALFGRLGAQGRRILVRELNDVTNRPPSLQRKTGARVSEGQLTSLGVEHVHLRGVVAGAGDTGAHAFEFGGVFG